MHRRLLAKAFDLLAVNTGFGTRAVPADRWRKLMMTVFPLMSDTKINLLMYVLDDDQTDTLSKSASSVISRRRHCFNAMNTNPLGSLTISVAEYDKMR